MAALTRWSQGEHSTLDLESDPCAWTSCAWFGPPDLNPGSVVLMPCPNWCPGFSSHQLASWGRSKQGCQKEQFLKLGKTCLSFCEVTAAISKQQNKSMSPLYAQETKSNSRPSLLRWRIHDNPHPWIHSGTFKDSLQQKRETHTECGCRIAQKSRALRLCANISAAARVPGLTVSSS